MKNVLEFPPQLIPSNRANAIRAGLPVRGSGQWQDMAAADLWLLARGSSLVVAGPTVTPIDPGGNAMLRYYAWPHEQCMGRVWCVGLATTTAAPAKGQLTADDPGVAHRWAIPGDVPGKVKQVVFGDPITSADATPRELALLLQLDADSLGSVMIASVGCYELPRSSLHPAGSLSNVPDDLSDASRRKIFDDVSGGVASVAPVLRGQIDAIAQARRACLMSWWYEAGVTITAPTYPGSSNLFDVDPPLLTRHLYEGEAQRTVRLAVKASKTGSNAKVKGITTSGGSCEFTITSGTPTWYVGDLTCSTDDMEALDSDGGLGGARDYLTMLAHRGSGEFDDVTIYGVCVGEP
jgi:hypothetical protein